MKQLKCEKVDITERGCTVVARDDSGHVPRFVYVVVDAEWFLSDDFARALDRAARRVLAREAAVDPATWDVPLFG